MFGFPAILTHTRVHGADFTMKYANNAPVTHPLTVRIKEATDAIRTETGGKVDIQVFPNNQLGADTDMLSQLRAGGIEFFTLSPLILSTLVPKASLSGLGFAWSGYEKLWPAMDGPLGAFVRAEIRKANLVAFEKIYDNGFRQITSSTRPIKTPEDLKNFKIRVPPSPLWTSMFKAFDAAPQTINFAEVYSALQTKLADGQENPLVTIDSAKLFEVQKYLSKTNHMWDGFWFLANARSFEKLPADVQAVIEKHINAGAVRAAGGHLPPELFSREGPDDQGPDLQRRRHGRVPGQAEIGRVLQGVAGQVRRRRMAAAGKELRRHAVTTEVISTTKATSWKR